MLGGHGFSFPMDLFGCGHSRPGFQQIFEEIVKKFLQMLIKSGHFWDWEETADQHSLHPVGSSRGGLGLIPKPLTCVHGVQNPAIMGN